MYNFNVNILHLSDLHFGMEKTEKIPATAVDKRNLTLSELIKTLKNVDEKWLPDLVAVSGDIGWKGKREDYDKAKDWLTKELLPMLKLAPDKLVICPGNHDIDREETFGMDPPSSTDDADEWLKLERNKNFSRPFEAFIDFCKNMMGISPLEIGDQSGNLTGKIDLHGLRFVILNSAWFCRGDDDPNNLWMGKPMLEKMAANNQLIDPDNYDVNASPVAIALFHHPHEWLNEAEYNTFGNRQNTLEYLSLRSHIILTGHVHARPAEPHRLFNRAWLVKGGASYAGSTYQNHFSILRIDTKNRKFDRLTFEFDPGKNRWRKNTEDNNLLSYDLKTSTSSTTSSPQLIIPGKYKEWVNAQCRDMDITKLAEATPFIQVHLPEIYIPLYANSLNKSDEKQAPVDIENLIAENRFLVIEGRAGSGKTTLAKHFTYMMIEKRELKGLDGYLPVLVFLKDLKGFGAVGLTGNSEMAEKLLAYWSKNTDSFLDIDVIRGFCKAGKAIFLLDGLDEIDESLRELIVTSFHGLKIKHENCKIILSGRPHGVDDIVKKWFGRPVAILPLLMTQVEAFIHKWFQVIYESERSGLKKTAQDMIGEIKSHPSIGELIDSPLMLTAICLLYNDNKELPGQRAELYDRFVTNLLYKRFRGEAQKVRNFLMHLAYSMQLKLSKTIDRLEAVRILGNEYKQKEGETQKEYNDRLNEKFELVEPGCGLLNSEKGGYAFIHLTFQEFLTANALVAGTSESYFDTIRQYWDDDWHREVVQLYIGYLSIQSQAMANNIIQRILKEKEGKPFARRRLAVRSFIDIHRFKRDDSVTRSSIDCLWEIINSNLELTIKAESGELLGRMGDSRDLEIFIPIPDGTYETSAGTVELKTFEMAKYPVTNRWYRKFIENNGYKKTEFWSKEGKKWLEREKAVYPRLWFDHEWNCDNYPVVGVSWYEADAFCRWLTQKRQDGFTYRLPDVKEWEAAAVGIQRQEYPWGNEYFCIKCNTAESEIGKTSAVGIFKDGDTLNSLSDMSGNVWEWSCTNSSTEIDQPDFKSSERVALRGGSWDDDLLNARCDDACRARPVAKDSAVGFRCSRTK